MFGFGDDAPEFRNARQTNTPALRVAHCRENGLACTLVLECVLTVRIDQQVRIKSDHPFLSIQSHMASRFDKSSSGSKPPFTVTRCTIFFLGLRSGFLSTI